MPLGARDADLRNCSILLSMESDMSFLREPSLSVRQSSQTNKERYYLSVEHTD